MGKKNYLDHLQLGAEVFHLRLQRLYLGGGVIRGVARGGGVACGSHGKGVLVLAATEVHVLTRLY